MEKRRIITIFILLIFIGVVFYLRTFFTNPTSASTQIGTSLGVMPSNGRQVVRTSSGTLYSFVNASGTCKIYKSSDGISWTEQDSGNHITTCQSTTPAAMAIDSTNKIHLVYVDATFGGIKYDTYSTSTDTFGTSENIHVESVLGVFSLDIAIDSSDKPHVVDAQSAGSVHMVEYWNRTSGSWSTTLNLTTDQDDSASIAIDKDNLPEICYVDVTTTTAVAAVGNQNNATSFSSAPGATKNLDTAVNTATSTAGCSIAIDSSGNTWVSYIGTTGHSTQVQLIEHKYADVWSTWQTTLNDSSHTGKAPSLATNGGDVYVFYQNSLDDVAYDEYTAAWKGEITLQTGTFQTIHAKYSYLNNNQGTAQIDYLYSDGTDVFWDKLSLQSSKRVNINEGTLPGGGRQVVRTSGGTIYSFVNDSGLCEVWKSTDGTTWSEQDAAHHPTCTSGMSVAIAIDSTDKLHFVYYSTTTVTYNTMSSDTYGTPETAMSPGTPNPSSSLDIAIDSANKPHVATAWYTSSCGTTCNGLIEYSNRVSGSWATTISTNGCRAAAMCDFGVSITLVSNIPEISWICTTALAPAVLGLDAMVGDQNNPTTFTVQGVDSNANVTAGIEGTSIVADSANNTWIGYVSKTGTNDINLIEHRSGDSWATWQTAVTDSKTGKAPSIAADGGAGVYIFYQNSADDVAVDKYTGQWSGETTLQTGTFQTVHAKWSYLNNNQGTTQVDYLYSDGTNVFWDQLGDSKIVFLESGTAETNDLSFWNGTGTTTVGGAGSTLTSDTQAVKGSVRSLKAAITTTGSSDCAYTLPYTDVLSDTGRRISFYVRWSNTTPTTRYAFFETENSADSLGQFGLALETSGKIGVFGGITAGSSNAIGTTVLQPNTDYRISIAYTINSSSSNSVTVYLNGNSEVTDTNDNQFNTGSKRFELGISDSTGTGPSKATTIYFSHIYIDDGTSGDPGDMRVTAKRPFSNGSSNPWTANGSSSGYGSGNATRVNERPPNTTDNVSTTTTSSTEEYTVESASAGDFDLSAFTIVDYMGWIESKADASKNSNILVNGLITIIPLTTTNTIFTQIAGTGSTYPTGGTTIGSTSGSAAGTYTMQEAGINVAYTAPAVIPTPTPGVKIQGGMKIQGGARIQ